MKSFLARLLIILTSAILLSTLPSVSEAQQRCSDLLAQGKRLVPFSGLIAKQSSNLNPKNGSGTIKFNIKNFLTKEYIEALYATLPKVGSFNLIIGEKDVLDQSSFPYPDFDVKTLAPIYEYANLVLKALNETLPEPERNRLSIEVLRIGISDGNQRQIDEGWHVDGIRYLTVVSNLLGAGTLIDANGPKQNKRNAPTAKPEEIEVLNSGNGIVFNGTLRNFVFPGPGSLPLVHRAPDGKTQRRMGIIMFLAPKDTNAPEISSLIRNIEPGSESETATRENLLEGMFADDRGE